MNIPRSATVEYFKGAQVDSTLTHVPNFADSAAQKTWFDTFKLGEVTANTYIRRERGSVKLSVPHNEIWDINYLRITNAGEDRFYAFVIDVNYINPNTTEVLYDVDPFQTFMFDMYYAQCFVEREMIVGDTVGANTLDEGLEMGEYIASSVIDHDYNNMYVVLWVSDVYDDSDFYGEFNNAGVFSGLKPMHANSTDQTTQYNYVNNIIQEYSRAGKLDAIRFINMVPADFLVAEGVVSPTPSRPTTINGYSPRNAKLFTYPYINIAVLNNDGDGVIWKYEYFTVDTGLSGYFIRKSFSVDGGAFLYPMAYKGVERNLEEGIGLTNLPACAWAGDIYANWLAQNKTKNVATTILGIGGIVAGVLTGSYAAAGAGFAAVASTMAKVSDTSVLPNQSYGKSTEALQVATNRVRFQVRSQTIKAEYARRIDDYFTRYGYKTNRLKVPNTRTRPFWNYVKVIDPAIVNQSIPPKYLDQVKQAFTRGVTFWHVDNGAVIGDYSMANGG